MKRNHSTARRLQERLETASRRIDRAVIDTLDDLEDEVRTSEFDAYQEGLRMRAEHGGSNDEG